ncbi:chemotaxis protein CheW [Vallitaleaceae bacterium 9-2]
METKQMKNEDIKQFIVVKFGHEQYGINIQIVQNIVRMPNITRVPNAPAYIKGVINLRGEIIPVMSVRVKFELEEDQFTHATRIIIVKVDGNAIGLIVDEVLEVIQLSEAQIEKIVSDADDEKSKYVYAVGKVGEELVTLLNVGSIIGVEE